MKRIIVNGHIPDKNDYVYEASCHKCGCVFEFEDEDIKSQERHPGGKKTVECPYCHTDITKTMFNSRPRLKPIFKE